MTIAFVACVERGPLEAQALLLARSLRRFGGRFHRARLHLFQPRAGRAISEATRAALSDLGAEVHATVLNRRFAEVGVLNKVYACAHAEQVLGEEILVFVDTDTVFVGEPAALALPEGVDAAVRIGYSRKLCSAGPGDPRDAYLREAFACCGLGDGLFLENEIVPFARERGRRIRAYFSSGLVAARRRAGLFRQWQADLERLVAAGQVVKACHANK